MPPTTRSVLDPAFTADRRTAWSTVMTGFVPGLPALEEAIGVAVEALRGGPPARVLDLGGGPGVFAERLAERWPDAGVALIDLDPVLLALARAGLPGRVDVRHADLVTDDWAGADLDLVTAVMTVHYLDAAQIRSLYAACRRSLTPGGVMVVADVMPDDGLPAMMAALDPAPGEAAAELAWAQWWNDLHVLPSLRPLLAARADLFRTRPPAGFTADVGWHVEAARAAGFDEVGLLWRDGRHAALAAY